MARSRLPLASVGGRPAEFSPADAQWKQIERAYGHSLPEAVRQGIREATTNFLRWEPYERAAELVSLARERVLTVQKGAKTLYDALVAAPSTTASVYAHHLIKRHLADEKYWRRKLRGQNEDKFERFRRLSELLVDACTSALTELNDPSRPGHREGDCWEGWVRNLTYIAKKHNLPTGARTDTRPSDKQSPFVALVSKLQQLVPVAAVHHAHSNDALAKAIQRARRRRGSGATSQTIPDLSDLSDESLFRYARR
jgi:hypothetical protein